MIQLLAGFQLSQALYTAAKLGIADCLRSGPKDAAALAPDIAADAHALRRVLRALASVEVFTETADGLFGLAPVGETLSQDSPASMRDLAIMWMERHYGPFGGLLEGVRTGRCAATTFYGQPFFSWLGRHPEQVERSSRSMANLTGVIKLGAISSCDFTDAGRIVDVGGADGTVTGSDLSDGTRPPGGHRHARRLRWRPACPAYSPPALSATAQSASNLL